MIMLLEMRATRPVCATVHVSASAFASGLRLDMRFHLPMSYQITISNPGFILGIWQFPKIHPNIDPKIF